MVENEFDDLITEGLFPEDRFTITSISVFLQDTCNYIGIKTHLKDTIDKLEERIKKLEEKNG